MLALSAANFAKPRKILSEEIYTPESIANYVIPLSHDFNMRGEDFHQLTSLAWSEPAPLLPSDVASTIDKTHQLVSHIHAICASRPWCNQHLIIPTPFHDKEETLRLRGMDVTVQTWKN